MGGWIEHGTAGADNHRTNLNGQFFRLVFKIDGAGRAIFFAGLALSVLKIDTIVCINGVLEGDRLGVLHIDRLAFAETRIVFIIHLFGAFFSAQTTSDTFVNLNISGALQDLDVKVPCLPGDALYLGKGQQFYV